MSSSDESSVEGFLEALRESERLEDLDLVSMQPSVMAQRFSESSFTGPLKFIAFHKLWQAQHSEQGFDPQPLLEEIAATFDSVRPSQTC